MVPVGYCTKLLSKQTRMVLRICLYGLAAGLATVAFQLAISALFRHGFKSLSTIGPGWFAMASLGIILVTSLLVGLILRLCPQAAGSGIPQLKAAFWADRGNIPLKVAIVKFTTGVLSIGGGCSLGREGPSVQLAGTVGSNLAAALGRSRRLGTVAGAAAGLAAAFNTPIAGITFVLEELIGDLGSRYLGGLLLASVLGALVTEGLVGNYPAFLMPPIASCSWHAYASAPLVAALAALVGVVFQQMTILTRGATRRLHRVPGWLMPAIGGLTTWVLGIVVFWRCSRLGVFSLGYDDLTDSLAGAIGWQTALLLLVGKLIATVACYGLGGSGGIFAPSLFLGAMTGSTTAGLLAHLMVLGPQDTMALTVVGMSATLGAVVRAPFTSIIIVFEMTREFAIVPLLMLAGLVSQAISRSILPHGFYDAILIQDGIDISRLEPPHDLQQWQELPVIAIANTSPVVASSLEPDQLASFIHRHRYNRFPAIVGTQLSGILARDEAAQAIKEGRRPRLVPATTCRPNDRIGQVQQSLISSGAGLAVVLDAAGKIVGIVTLHDILRAQTDTAKKVQPEDPTEELLS